MARGGARAGAGRKAHEPTEHLRKQVEALAGYGIPLSQIGAVVGMDEKTMRAYYALELERGKALANAKVAQTLFERATKDRDTTAAIWWTKARMGWTDKTDVNLKVTGLGDILAAIDGRALKPVQDGEG